MDNKLELVSVKIMIQLIKSHNLLQVHNCSHKPFRQMVNKPLSLQAHNKHDKSIQLNNGADSLISTAYLKVVDLTGVNVVHYMKAWRYNGNRAGGYMSRQEGMWHCIIYYPPTHPTSPWSCSHGCFISSSRSFKGPGWGVSMKGWRGLICAYI